MKTHTYFVNQAGLSFVCRSGRCLWRKGLLFLFVGVNGRRSRYNSRRKAGRCRGGASGKGSKYLVLLWNDCRSSSSRGLRRFGTYRRAEFVRFGARSPLNEGNGTNDSDRYIVSTRSMTSWASTFISIRINTFKLIVKYNVKE
jgi:hypothetical protein